MDNIQFREVPKSALQFSIGECTFGDNGEGSKTAPFRMVARSAQPLNHFFFGNLVHDMAGMRLNKPRLSIDYEHNEIIGYANKFDTADGNLTASGVIQSVQPNDRAYEVIVRGQSGQPYESSIFHDNDIVIEEIPDGVPVNVNGLDLVGPLCIIREWCLRAIAICKAGYDKNTSTQLNDAVEKVQIKIKRNDMENKTLEGVTELATPVEGDVQDMAVQEEAQVEPVVEPVVEPEVETEAEVSAPSVEANVAVTVIVEATAAVETEAKDEGETDEATVVEPESPVAVAEEVQPSGNVPLKQEDMLTLTALNETYSQRIVEFETLVATLKAENENLQTRLNTIRDSGEKQPVSFEAEVKDNGLDMALVNKLAKGMNPSLATFAASLKLPKR